MEKDHVEKPSNGATPSWRGYPSGMCKRVNSTFYIVKYREKGIFAHEPVRVLRSVREYLK